LQRVTAARETFADALRLTGAAALSDATEFTGTAEQGLAQAALASGEAASAREHATAALRLALARGDITQLVASLRLLASSEAAAGHKGLAARTLRSAIALLERVPIGELNPEQRATYLATQYALFGELTDLLIPGTDSTGEAQAWRAFDVAEAGHARSLRYAMELAVHERAAGAEQGGSREYRALLRAISAMSSNHAADGYRQLPLELDKLTRQSASAEGTISRTELAGQLTRMRSVLVEYAAGQDDMYAFVTDGATMHAVHLGPRAAIAHAAAAFLRQLRKPEPVVPLIRQTAKDLARLVWWPLRPYLSGQRIVIVPDDALHTIPFAALPWSSESPSDLTVQHVAVSSVPATLLLARNVPNGAARRGRDRFVLLGDPVLRLNLWRRNCAGSVQGYRQSDELPQPLAAAFQWARPLPSLPGTRAEVDSV
ncbi:MAG: CHAT domain-containing protein, partial [Steroidobacteraceae bacterium]